MARLTLNTGESVGLSSGNFTIYGTASGAETVTVAAGTTVTFDPSFNRGGDVITLAGNAATYSAIRSGSSVVLTDATGAVVTIPVGGNVATTLKFGDDAAGRALSYDTQALAITLGGQTISASTVVVAAGSGGSGTDAAKTMVLTTGLNTGTGFTGGSGDDTYDAATSNSLNTGDVLDGGAGTDVLTANLNGSTLAPTMSNIETASLTVTGSTATINAANISGLTTINSVNSNANLTVNNLGTVGTLGLNTTSGTTTLNYTSAALAGSADKLTINLDGVSSSTVTLTRAAGNTNSLERVAINSGSVSNTLTQLSSSGANVSALEIGGSQDLSISTALDAGIRTVDASAATGAVTLSSGSGSMTVTGGTGNDVFTTSSGNDVITLGEGADTVTSGGGNDNLSGGGGADAFNFDGADLDRGDTISGGDGSDTIRLTANHTVVDNDFLNISNVETLTVSAGGNGITATLGANADASGLATITGSGAAVDAITVGAGFDNALRINLGGGVDEIDASASNASITVAAVASNITSADNMVGGALAGDVIRVTADGGTATFGANVSGFETVTVVGVGENDVTIALHDDMVYLANSITVDASLMTNSNADLTLTSAESNTNATVNVTGGAGNDVITGFAEKSNFSGGAGDDTFSFNASHLTSADTINGGSGTDNILISADYAVQVQDNDFLNVTNVEVLTVTAGQNLIVTLGANADTAGLSTITGAGAGNDVITVGSGFDNALRVNLGGNNDRVVASSSNAAITVAVAEANIDAGDTLIGGLGSGDVIRITAGSGSAAFGSNVSGFETVTVVGVGDNDVSIALSDEMVTGSNSITVDASLMSNSNADLTLTSAESNTNATVNVTGGAGNDVITGFAEKSNFSGGAGDDTFSFNASHLTSADTIDGGSGTDNILISANYAAGVQDGDFLNVTNVEVLTVTADENLIVTLGANADTAGVSTITGAGTGNDVITVGSGFDNALRVNLGGDNDRVDASASAAAITVAAAEANIDAGDTLIGGTGSGDVIRITAGSGSAAFGSNVSGFETIQVIGVNDTAVSVTTSDAMVTLTGTLTVDASSMSNSNANFTFVSGESADTGATVNVTGGAGSDSMTGGAETSNFSGNNGADTFIFTAANLDRYDTISGGLGNDNLNISDGGAVVDADFTNVTGVENLQATSGNVAVTLGAFADASGLATITGGTGDDVITIGSGFDNSLRVNLGGGNDVVNATGSNAVITVFGEDAVTWQNDTLIGGATAGDVIRLAEGSNANFGGNVSGFETITITYNSAGSTTTKVVTHDNMVAAGATLTINASAANSAGDAFNFSGSAELNGRFSITGSAGADSISGGLQADTISGANGADTILGGGGADVLTGGNGNDVITGGVGADTITLDAGNDTVKFTSSVFSEGGDTIADFVVGEDNISFADSMMGDGDNDLATLKEIAVNGIVAENDVFIQITTEFAGSDLTNASTVASNLSALTLQGMNASASETLMFALSDGDDTYIWLFTEDGQAGIQADDLTFVAKLTGVTDVEDGDFVLG